MKRKLVYDDSDNEESSKSDAAVLHSEEERSEGYLEYEPTHFLRCHSRKNDPADVRTQVWQCAFEPDLNNPNKTTDLVATCGGNSICLINAKTGKVAAKYNSKDVREMFYSIAWTTLLVDSGDPPHINILAAAGARNTLHLIHPEGGMAFFEHSFTKTKKVNVSSLLFLPEHSSTLFCGLSDGEVLVCDIGTPAPPHYNVEFEHWLTLGSNSEIFSLVYSLRDGVLLAACNSGVRGWVVTHKTLRKKCASTPLLEFRFPKKSEEGTGRESQLVDSVEVVGDGLIATKCALHGVIYLWNLTATLADQQTNFTVTPTHTLRWSDTDNYFMGMGCHPVSQLLACGDDRGALWLYDLKEMTQGFNVKPSAILDWPTVSDNYVDRNRKLRLGVYDIVVDKVAVSWNRKYLVAVTSNNMVCIWKCVHSC